MPWSEGPDHGVLAGGSNRPGDRKLGRAGPRHCPAVGSGGARIAFNYHREEERAGRVLEEARDAGIEAHLVRADVTSENDVLALHAEGLRSWGRSTSWC